VFERWAGHYGVSPALLEAMCWMESGWQNTVVSSTGAVGIGQLMPDTVDWARMTTGLALDPHRPDDNIRMSARFLRFLLDNTGDQRTALAAYYQGLRSIREGPLLPDTKNYVEVIQLLVPRFS
jgi:soluble lytic murein transglycosylase-like protein